MLRAGSLRHRVTIQTLDAESPSQDAGGAPNDTWSDVKTVWAAVEPLRGRELLAAQQVASEVTGTIRMRYEAGQGVTAKHRCKFGTRYYDILAVVNPTERNKELLLYVREGPNNG